MYYANVSLENVSSFYRLKRGVVFEHFSSKEDVGKSMVLGNEMLLPT